MSFYLYLFSSQVSKGSRSADSSIVLTVVAGKPPVVTILTSTLRVVTSDRVKLEATYESAVRPVKVEWICEQEDSKFFTRTYLAFAFVHFPFT